MKHTLLCQIKSMQKGSEDTSIETLYTFMNLSVQNKQWHFEHVQRYLKCCD
jgi:hypothetical protein